MNYVEHAERELRLCGLAYANPKLARDIIAVVAGLGKFGRDGSTPAQGAEIVRRLLALEPLTELTDNPADWSGYRRDSNSDTVLWQNRRNPRAWSTNGGVTYWLADGPDDPATRLLQSWPVKHAAPAEVQARAGAAIPNQCSIRT